MYIGDSNFDTQICSDELAPEYFPTVEDLAEAGRFFAEQHMLELEQLSDDGWLIWEKESSSNGHHAHEWLNPDKPNEDFDWLFITV